MERGFNMFSLNEQKAIELGESGEKAIREQNDYDALQYVQYLQELGVELLEANLETDLKRVVISLRNIGNKATQKKIEDVSSTTVKVLKTLSEPALEKDFSNALWSFSKAVQEIGKGAVKSHMLVTAESAVETLEVIGSGAVAKKMPVVTLWTTMALGEIDYLAKGQKLEDLSKAAKEAREKIINSSETAGFIPREQIEKYPQLIATSLTEFSEGQLLQPAGYEGRPNEEFTEEDFFEGEIEEPGTDVSEQKK
jgi:hypothetical protein